MNNNLQGVNNMKRYIRSTTTDGKLMQPYKGYNIEKTWEVDSRGHKIPGSDRFSVIDEDDDWIGDIYRTLKEAHQYIDDFVAGKVDSLA